MKNYELGLYEKSMPNNLTFREKLGYAKDNGFDYLEISIDETEEKLSRLYMSKSDRLRIIKDMYEVGIPIRTMCLSAHRKYSLGSKDIEVRKKGMEIMERAIELADDLGVRIIQMAGYDVYYEKGDEETKLLFEENLKKSVQIAAIKGVILAFETMETDFMNTVEKAMYYVKLINSPYLQIYPDCGNVTNAKLGKVTEVINDFMIGKDHLVAVHLKETVPGKFREIPFGVGHVDFREIIKASFNLGVRKFTVEFWYVGNENWKDILKEVREFMDEKFNSSINY